MACRTAGVLALVGSLLFVGCGDDDETAGTRAARSTIVSTSRPAPPVSEDRVRLEYQPGVYLSLVEPGLCADGPQPAMVTLSQQFADEFAARGYLGVVVEARQPDYEPVFDARIVRAIGSVVHDMAIAVQWLRAHADEYCVNADAIAATGHSFGALAALALAYSEGEEPVGSITIDEFGGTIAVEPVELGPVPPELAPYSNDLDGVVSFSGFALADHIDSGEPPAIMFHGRNDGVVPFSLAEQTCTAAQAVGVTCELVPHDGGHAAAPDLAAALDQAEQFLEREMLPRSPRIDDT